MLLCLELMVCVCVLIWLWVNICFWFVVFVVTWTSCCRGLRLVVGFILFNAIVETC